MQLVWRNIVGLTLFHIWAIRGYYILLTGQVRLSTFLLCVTLGYLAAFGIVSGTHRLWSHRSYKAKLPLRLFLLFCNCIANQNSVYVWARDHRLHHKYTDTDADPHSINRGFFFAHVGWLLVRKDPEVLAKGKTIDLTDLEREKLIMFQRKYFEILGVLCSFVIPTLIPWYFWGETMYTSLCANMARYIYTLHCAFSINSFGHFYGSKPYDMDMGPVDNVVLSILTHGEGYHNYHHTFPWDYKAAEVVNYGLNVNTAFIDLMAKIGWAYDLKSVPQEAVDKIKNKQ